MLECQCQPIITVGVRKLTDFATRDHEHLNTSLRIVDSRSIDNRDGFFPRNITPRSGIEGIRKSVHDLSEKDLRGLRKI